MALQLIVAFYHLWLWVCPSQLRKLTVEGCQYRSIHQQLMRDLLRLSTSTYSQVSSAGSFKYCRCCWLVYWYLNSVFKRITNWDLLPSRYAAKLKMCCSLHWEPTISAAEIWSLMSLSFSTRTTALLLSSNSKYDSQLCTTETLEQLLIFIYLLLLYLHLSRVPCTVCWGITAECAWPICMTGSALLWRGLPLSGPASAQPCLWRSPPLCGSSMISQTKSIASMRPSASTSLWVQLSTLLKINYGIGFCLWWWKHISSTVFWSFFFFLQKHIAVIWRKMHKIGVLWLIWALSLSFINHWGIPSIFKDTYFEGSNVIWLTVADDATSLTTKLQSCSYSLFWIHLYCKALSKQCCCIWLNLSTKYISLNFRMFLSVAT